MRLIILILFCIILALNILQVRAFADLYDNLNKIDKRLKNVELSITLEGE